MIRHPQSWGRSIWVPRLMLAYCPGVFSSVGSTQPHSMFNAPYLMQVFGSLLLVFACLFGLVFILKKMNRLPTKEQKPIRVLSSIKVGSREKIIVVETGENQILVGVTAASIHTLYVFGGAAAAAGNELPPTANFASLLHPQAPQSEGN